MRLRLYGLFLISGSTGLGYQMIWAKRLSMGLGHEVPAVFAVVTAFLGGMSIGALFFDRWIARSGAPGKWYAALEGVIGCWGLLTIWLIPFGNTLGFRLMGAEPSAVRHWAAAFLIPLILLLPATACLGASFPAMERFAAGCGGRGCVGGVYAANTFGAVAGVLGTAYGLMPRMGFREATVVAVFGNVVCAGVAWVLARGQGTMPAAEGEGDKRSAGWLLFASGFLGIGYEAVGVRALSQVLENTVFTYAAVLSVFLGGTAAGAALYQKWSERSPWRKGISVGHAFGGTGLAAFLGMLAMAVSAGVYGRLRGIFSESISGVMLAEMGLAILVFGLPAIGMGMVFSHLAERMQGADGGVGRASGINTLGGALAAPVFGIGLIPAIGLKWSFVALGAGYLVLAGKPWNRWGWWAGGIALVLLAPGDLRLVTVDDGNSVREFREGILGSVAVLEDRRGERTLRVDNRFQMGGTAAAVALKREAHIPLLLHGPASRVLFLGVGTGITMGAAAKYPVDAMDGVELLQEVLKVLPEFGAANSEPWRDPRVRLVASDARRFVRSSGERYDVIIGDLFHPARDGAGSLYTVEHFKGVRERLKAGGLFCQWLPLHQMDGETLRMIVRTFLQVYPRGEAYLLRFNIDAPVIGLVGRKEVARYGAGWVEGQAAAAGLRAELNGCALNDSVRLFGCLLAGSEQLKEFAGKGALNTDDHPLVTFTAPRYDYRKRAKPYESLFAFLNGSNGDASGALGLEEDDPMRGRVREFMAARDIYLKGLVEESEGKVAEAIADYVESARKSSEFTSGYAQCVTLASILARDNPETARRLLEQLVEAQPGQPLARELLRRMK